MNCPNCGSDSARRVERQLFGSSDEIHISCECPACGKIVRHAYRTTPANARNVRYSAFFICPPRCEYRDFPLG